LPAEMLGKQKTSWQVVTVIFFLTLLSLNELRYTNETSIWWVRAWNQAGPVLVGITVALTIFSALAYAWRHRELIAPNEQSSSPNCESSQSCAFSAQICSTQRVNVIRSK